MLPDEALKLADEPGWVGAGEMGGGGIVQGQILRLGAVGPVMDECGFPGLAGAVDEDDRGISEGVLDGPLNVSPESGDNFTSTW